MPNGSVYKPEVLEDTLRCPPLTAAIIRRVNGWRFPPIVHGVMTVDYPFIFIAPGDIKGWNLPESGP